MLFLFCEGENTDTTSNAGETCCIESYFSIKVAARVSLVAVSRDTAFYTGELGELAYHTNDIHVLEM